MRTQASLKTRPVTASFGKLLIWDSSDGRMGARVSLLTRNHSDVAAPNACSSSCPVVLNTKSRKKKRQTHPCFNGEFIAPNRLIRKTHTDA